MLPSLTHAFRPPTEGSLPNQNGCETKFALAGFARAPRPERQGQKVTPGNGKRKVVAYALPLRCVVI